MTRNTYEFSNPRGNSPSRSTKVVFVSKYRLLMCDKRYCTWESVDLPSFDSSLNFIIVFVSGHWLLRFQTVRLVVVLVGTVKPTIIDTYLYSFIRKTDQFVRFLVTKRSVWNDSFRYNDKTTYILLTRFGIILNRIYGVKV